MEILARRANGQPLGFLVSVEGNCEAILHHSQVSLTSLESARFFFQISIKTSVGLMYNIFPLFANPAINSYFL